MRIFIPLVLIALGVGFFAGSFCSSGKPVNTAPPGDTTLSPENAPAEEDTKSATMPDFAFKPRTFHYGKVVEGESRSTKLIIERPAGAELKIGRIFSPCPCITVSAEKKEFKAGEDAVIKVDIHSLTLIGKPSFPVYVQILEPVKGSIRADVTIEVNRVPAKIKLIPDGFHLGSVKGEKNACVFFYNLTKRPVELKNLKSSIKGVKLAVVGGARVPAGMVGTISLTVPKEMKHGPLRGVVTVETSLPEHAVISITVDGTVLRK